MNRWIVNAALAALLSGAAGSPTKAAEANTDAVLACANEPDDARRLRCFDATVEALRGARGAPAAGPAVAAAAAPAAATPSPPAPAAPAAAASPETSAPVSAEDRFGLRGDLKKQKLGELSELTATVTEISTKPHGELVITLENGQVWAEIAPGSKIRLKPGDSVKIEAGSLGSFFLIAPNNRSSKVSRVR